MKIHMGVEKEMPKQGRPYTPICKTPILNAAFPFAIEGDARWADLQKLGNCYGCKTGAKELVLDGEHVVFGVAEAQELLETEGLGA